MRPATTLQRHLFHAQVADVGRQRLLVPWKRAMALEAWKRYFLALYVREVRLEAYGTGQGDPFPARAARFSELDSSQASELIESTFAAGTEFGIEWSVKVEKFNEEMTK